MTVHYVKEGQDRYGIGGHDQVVGAVLRRSTNPCDVDAWRPCYDLSEMLRHQATEVIYGGSEAEIESEVWKRHPVEGEGVSLVTKDGLGWEIERIPRLMHADLNLLHDACATHRRVLVGNDLVQALGGPERLLGLGFLLDDRRSRRAQLVRHNPRQVVINRWKRDVEGLRQYFGPEFPPALVGELFEAVRPEHWHAEHPYKGILKTDCNVTGPENGYRGSWGSRHCRRRCRPEQANATGAARTILTFVGVAGRLGKGEHRKPWRRTCQWKELLERLVEYVHGVEVSGDADWKKLARWVRAEARAAKVKVPRMKKLPPRPTFGKKAAGDGPDTGQESSTRSSDPCHDRTNPTGRKPGRVKGPPSVSPAENWPLSLRLFGSTRPRTSKEGRASGTSSSRRLPRTAACLIPWIARRSTGCASG